MDKWVKSFAIAAISILFLILVTLIAMFSPIGAIFCMIATLFIVIKFLFYDDWSE